MQHTAKLVLLAVLFALNCLVVSSYENPLNGKVLRIFASELPPYMMVKRNSTGNITEISGYCVENLNWLSKYLGFSYLITDLPVQKQFDNIGNQLGTISYLLNGEADWIIGVVILTESRNKLTRLPFPLTFNYASALLPYPAQKANILAPFEPFSFEVWMLLLVAVVVTSSAMKLLTQIYDVLTKFNYVGEFGFNTMTRSIEYVYSILLSQGAVCFSRRLNIRLIAITWCLAAFVLVNAYSSTLTSFVSAPNRQLLVHSVYEVPDKPQVKLVVVKGKGADVLISSGESKIRLAFRTMLDQDPSLRCLKVEKCLEMVRSGSKVLFDAYPVIMQEMNKDLRETGQCRYTATKERVAFLPASFVTPKNNDYIEHVNKGIMTMWDTGLINFWDKKSVPIPTSCLNIKLTAAKTTRLSLANLTGPFIILLVGYGLSLVAFISECVITRLQLKMRSGILQF